MYDRLPGSKPAIVTCLCSRRFCFVCQHEPHAPATCREMEALSTKLQLENEARIFGITRAASDATAAFLRLIDPNTLKQVHAQPQSPAPAADAVQKATACLVQSIAAVKCVQVKRVALCEASEHEQKLAAMAERKKKEEDERQRRLKIAQVPVVVWYNERLAQLLPTKTHTWAELKMMIFEHFELPEDDSELRIVVHSNRGMCQEGAITPIDEDDDTLLEDVEGLTKYGVLQVESRVDDSPWKTQVAHDAAVSTQMLAVPTEMMLCNPDGSSKHVRWFWVDLKSRSLSWAQKPHGE
eukprot:COSAG02_NODE_1310_length_13323_cov_17.158878_1_plen_295_part_10